MPPEQASTNQCWLDVVLRGSTWHNKLRFLTQHPHWSTRSTGTYERKIPHYIRSLSESLNARLITGLHRTCKRNLYKNIFIQKTWVSLFLWIWDTVLACVHTLHHQISQYCVSVEDMHMGLHTHTLLVQCHMWKQHSEGREYFSQVAEKRKDSVLLVAARRLIKKKNGAARLPLHSATCKHLLSTCIYMRFRSKPLSQIRFFFRHYTFFIWCSVVFMLAYCAFGHHLVNISWLPVSVTAGTTS